MALSRKYDQSLEGLLQHVDDLLYRFANPHLGDTIARVGKDPIRKLGSEDRLIGAAKCCLEQGINPVYISFGVAAALLFKDQEDEPFNKLKEQVEGEGVKSVMAKFSAMKEQSWLMKAVEDNHNELHKGTSLLDMVTELEFQKIG